MLDVLPVAIKRHRNWLSPNECDSPVPRIGVRARRDDKGHANGRNNHSNDARLPDQSQRNGKTSLRVAATTGRIGVPVTRRHIGLSALSQNWVGVRDCSGYGA